jgi:hypothetical protein
LHDKLVFWAQSQIVGKLWTQDNVDFASSLGKLWELQELTYDSRLIEYFGQEYGKATAMLGEPIFEYLARHVELEDRLELSDKILRAIIVEMLSTHTEYSRFWRNPLKRALRALSFGHTIEPLVPTQERRRAELFSTMELKSMALCHINYLVGQGLKKRIALERVSNVLNQSPKTIRSWEKLLKYDEDYVANAYATQLASRFEKQIEAGKIEVLEDEYGDEGHRNESYWKLAKVQFARFRNISLERIRDELNKIRR